jgi:mannose-6-phosphate isomerase-like protein (cupin superfamily)
MTFTHLSLGTPVVRAADTITGDLGGIGARFIMNGEIAENRFSLIEHPIVPRGLAAPMHLHTREDEYSFVLEGTWGFKLGDEVVHAGPGDLVYKPRNVWHTFWNASDQPARLLEIISPAGFEYFFEKLAKVLESDPDDIDAVVALNAQYGLEMDFSSVPGLVAAHGLVAADVDAAMVDDEPPDRERH